MCSQDASLKETLLSWNNQDAQPLDDDLWGRLFLQSPQPEKCPSVSAFPTLFKNST
jgi:hypothetical protein